MIARAKRPVIYAGGGVIRSGCHGLLYELAKKNGIPVALTLMGLGAFPPDDPLYLGMLGMHGSPLCNIALDEADLVLAFGSRFDDRAVGRADEFCRKADIIHVDVDAAEIHKIKRADLPIVGDLGLVIDALLPLVGSDSRHHGFRGSRKSGPPSRRAFRRNGGLHPIDAIKVRPFPGPGRYYRLHRRGTAPDVGGPGLSFCKSRAPFSRQAAWAPWGSAFPPP